MKDALFRLLMRLHRILFARRFFYSLNKFLFNLSLRGIGILNEEDTRYPSSGEQYLLRGLAAAWGKSPTILDVGAHEGKYARMIMQLAPRACLYAFEPHPVAFAALQREAERLGYIAVNIGCGDHTCTAALYDYEDHQGSHHASLHKGVIETLHKGKPVATPIRVIPLDEFIRDHKIPRVHLVKIDVEGEELNVLRGLRSAIAERRIDIVQFEFNAMNVISRSFFRDFYAVLPNYRFYRLLPDGPVGLGEYRPIFCELFAFQNIVAVREGCEVRL